jgi:transposase, IS30 family
MKMYKHLTVQERERIAVWKGQGLSLREIAQKVGRHASTLSRELNRNRSLHGYWPHKASERARWRECNSHTRLRLKSRTIRHEIEQMLQKGWSPELAAGRLRRQHPELPLINHESIYQWIYAERRDLVRYLAHAHRKRKRRWKASSRKTRIPDRVSILHRPSSVSQRKEPGHWETDLIVGAGRAALQVLVERKSRYTRIGKIRDKSAPSSRQALHRLMAPLHPSLRRSITYDNGPENTEHATLNVLLGTRSWFCEPYHSWEKAQVENTNGLIRRFVPKRTNLDDLPDEKIQKIEGWLNDRPRKVLQFQTPNEVFNTYCCT